MESRRKSGMLVARDCVIRNRESNSWMLRSVTIGYVSSRLNEKGATYNWDASCS